MQHQLGRIRAERDATAPAKSVSTQKPPKVEEVTRCRLDRSQKELLRRAEPERVGLRQLRKQVEDGVILSAHVGG